MIKILVGLLVISSFVLCSERPKPVNIPSISQVYKSDWYSGYLDIDEGKTHMHYFFFPSQNSSSTDPLLFWFNGGPGCSSLLGALYQHGPFLINDAFASIMYNPYGWNQKANVVYIQSPSQVGFSYMDTKPPTWNDDLVAQLNARTVREFFYVWPEYVDRDTYLSGESYAGIYVPTLFYELHRTNDVSIMKVNLKGFAVGNGCTDPTECEFQNDYPIFLMQLYRDIGYISENFYQEIDKKCKNQGQDLNKECQDVLQKVDNLMTGINIYDVYRPCYQNNAVDGLSINTKELRRLALRKRKYPTQKLTWAPPCVDSLGIDNLLLDKENRKAMGIPDKVMDYSMCNANDDFQYDRSIRGSYWVYQKLVPLNKYKIIIYSGDSDPAVPFAGTRFWWNKLRSELGLSTEEYWRPWFTKTANGRQNSGSTWVISNNMRLVTFKGIGHMAPQWNYEGGYKMISNLLHNQPL